MFNVCYSYISAHAIDIYIGPDRLDANNGLVGKPLGSLAATQKTARMYVVNEKVTVHVANGIHYLPDTLIFTPDDSGSEKYPLIYKATA